MARVPLLLGFKYVTSILRAMFVADESGVERKVYDSDGFLYQQGTKITATAAQINALSNTFVLPLIDDGDDGVTLTSADQTHASPVVTIPDIGDAADTFCMLDTVQTVTNKIIDADSNKVKHVVQAYAGNITRAEMITGKTLVAGVSGRTIRVLGVRLKVNGGFSSGAGTSFVIQDTNSSPVAILTSLKAALTDGAKISTYGLAISNVTEGAGMTADLTADKGIAVAADAAWDAGTSIDIIITYMYT